MYLLHCILPIFAFGAYARHHDFLHDMSLTPVNRERMFLASRQLFSFADFGGRTHSSGSGVQYSGNVGIPYGSNIVKASLAKANRYKYSVRFECQDQNQPWTVVIWNKFGPDGGLGGWYGKACKTFTLAAGQVRYIAFDEDSQGGWAAAPGSVIPIDRNGGYASTWGEFDFGSTVNHRWSGFDVSAIAAQNAGLEVQGMRICDIITDICSFVTPQASVVHNAYTSSLADVDGIGVNLAPGPVRLAVTIGYDV